MAQEQHALQNLRVNGAAAPLGIDDPAPKFSWILSLDGFGRAQSAWRILVSSSEENAAACRGDVWDSGKRPGGNNYDIAFEGKLDSRTPYYWRVQAWDEKDACLGWSETAVFETGIFAPAEWGASWIACPERPGIDPLENRAARLLRREFEVPGEVERARAYICGLGLFDMTINGKPADDTVLNPGNTQFNKTVPYCVFDVTGLLSPGINAVAVELGNGFYNEADGAWNWENAPWRSAPRLLFRLDIRCRDGGIQTVLSDGSWFGSDGGPTRRNSIYYGEAYDARLEMPGWRLPGFQGDGFQRAVVVSPPAPAVKFQYCPPMRRREAYRPAGITSPAPGVWVIRSPKMLTGWMRLRLRAAAGTKITVTYAETLAQDGCVRGVKMDIFPEGPLQQDVYIARGDGEEIFEPRFSYKGYAYVQIDGYPGELTAEDVELFRICSDVEGVSRFATSSDYVNSLHVIMTNTLLNNFQGKPTDTPVWEKNGWTGDVNVTLGSMSFNYDVGGLLQYYEDMMRDCQLENGLVPLIAPAADWGREDHVVWSSLYILLVEHLERVYGKERYAASQYESMRRLAKLYIAKAEQGGWILPGGELSDWVAPAGGTKPGVPGHASSSEGSAACAAYFACAALRAMQTLAQRLGLAADAAEYESARKKLEEAFNAHFLDKERGLYETGDWAAMGSRTRYRQTTNLAALAMGIVPPEYRERVVENLVADIEEKGEHLDTGMVGTRLILPTLSEAGHPQLAYRLLTQTTYPSWGYWLASGATSCWEGYEETCRSRDHYFLGTYEQWLFEYLAGIRDVRGGFRSLTLAPLWPDGLDWVRAELDTVRGRLASAWSREEGGIVYESAIPTGTAAVIRLPLPEGAGLQINGAQPGAPIPGVIDLRREDGKLTVQAGSGVYRFQIYPQADK